MSSIARRLARFSDRANCRVRKLPRGTRISDNTRSCQQTTAAPIRQTAIFNGSRITRPNSASRPPVTASVSWVKRLIRSLVPSLANVATSMFKVRRKKRRRSPSAPRWDNRETNTVLAIRNRILATVSTNSTPMNMVSV